MGQHPTDLKIGDDLYVMVVEIASLREQALNAQVMQPRHFERLTENIRQRGQLEALPYCHWPNRSGPIEIISGHHRTRAARAAGLTHVPVIVDVRPMRRSEIVAKQIAHNELHGTPDEDTLRQLLSIIDNVDDLLATGLPEGFLPTADDDDTKLSIPNADFEFETVTLLFLPEQMADFTRAVDAIEKTSEMVGVARVDQFTEFAEAVIGYGRTHNIRSVATTVAVLAELAHRETDQATSNEVEPNSRWVRAAHLVGPFIPPETAQVIERAVSKLIKEGDIPPDQPWLALERLAADYLSGS